MDEVLPEPLGGAQRGKREAIEAVGDVIERSLRELSKFDGAALREQRREKFLEMGQKGLA